MIRGTVRSAVVLVFMSSFFPAVADDKPATTPPTEAQVASALADRLFDAKTSDKERHAEIAKRPEVAVALIRELTGNLGEGDSKEEYRRIPWIWRAAVTLSKRNDAGEILKLLNVSLPDGHRPMRHWQAVVIGGGVVNALGELRLDPRARVFEIVGQSLDLRTRWERAIEQSFAMADDPAVPTGTRYDALRLIAMADWAKAAPALKKYLAKDAHPELQMGAVSGLADAQSPEVAAVLLSALPDLAPRNRTLAIDGLTRHVARATALLDAVDAGRVARADLSPDVLKHLRELKDENVSRRAEALK